MARIMLGLGTSHTPMLLIDASDLSRYEENDRRLSLLDTDGAPITFDALLRRGTALPDVSAQQLSARHAAARQAIAGLADKLNAAALDVLIIIGDDQKEMLRDGSMPQLLIYDRPILRSQRPPHAPGRPAWVLRGTDRYYPADAPRDYPVAATLARHIGGHLAEQGFKVTPVDFKDDNVPMGHAFAFVHSQLMRDPPIPVVPVLLNALYPPDQPTPAQCLEIGEAIAHAVSEFPEDARVGVVASGGLSHFVVDEQLDRDVVRALQERDYATLATLPVDRLNSGSGEIRNWICAAGALRSLRIERIDYIPGYRTRAGTGTGLCFAEWR